MRGKNRSIDKIGTLKNVTKLTFSMNGDASATNFLILADHVFCVIPGCIKGFERSIFYIRRAKRIKCTGLR